MIVQENEDINNILFGYIHALLHPVSKLSISLNKSLCYMYYSIRQRDILNFLLHMGQSEWKNHESNF